MPYPSSGLPSDLFTSDNLGTRRIRADVAQTGFFEGREFRFDYEISAPIVFKFSSPIDFFLQSQDLSGHDGLSTLTVWAPEQGTPSGTFNTPETTLPNNFTSTAPSYTPQITISSGGGFTPTDPDPNKAREYIKVKTAQATAQRSTIGGTAVKERGLPAGDYYLVFTGTDASYRLVYEERP